jgi:methionyl-tRNA formyltransferase
METLHQKIALVVTQPDRPQGRGMKLTPTQVKARAQELGLEVATPEKARSPEFVERIEAMRPDALVVASYGQILSQRLLDSAIRGGINMHGSILPRYRGAAPIQRAILAGERETGVTLMQMDRGMDSGDIISIIRTPIEPDETYGQLQDRLALIAADMICNWIEKIVKGDYPRTGQDTSLVTLAPKIERSECALHVSNPAESEYNRFRAFSPTPGTFLRTRMGTIKVVRAALGGGTGAQGTVLSTADGLEIGFAQGSVVLVEVQPEGKKRMSGRDFANGNRLKPGISLL